MLIPILPMSFWYYCAQERALRFIEQFRPDTPDLLDEEIMPSLLRGASTLGSRSLLVRRHWAGHGCGALMIKEWAAPEGRIHFSGDFTALKTGWAKAPSNLACRSR
jgi:hypothetical protein